MTHRENERLSFHCDYDCHRIIPFFHGNKSEIGENLFSDPQQQKINV